MAYLNKDDRDDIQMKKILGSWVYGIVIVSLAACQSAPQKFNGSTGYQIEHQTQNSATISYTMASRANHDIDEHKLQRACQKALGTQQKLTINIISVTEIANPNAGQPERSGVQIGQSRATFVFSNTQSYNSSDDRATLQALETRPSTLNIVRYNCSVAVTN